MVAMAEHTTAHSTLWEIANRPTYHADADDDDEVSVDTQDALLEMLGLQNLAVPSSNRNADTDTTSEYDAAKVTLDMNILTMEEDKEEPKSDALSCSPIKLPRKCSRYGYAPSQCAAVLVRQFLSPSECHSLLERANNLPPPQGYQYITQASHTAPDGTTHQVQLQQPNPHKLAVFEHAPTLDFLWKRLLDQVQLNQCDWLHDFQKRTGCGPPIGLNPRLRIVKYDADDDDRFEPHFDATTHVGPYTSLITVLLYLNTGGSFIQKDESDTKEKSKHQDSTSHDVCTKPEFEGGETLFLDAHISDCKKGLASGPNDQSSSGGNKSRVQEGGRVCDHGNENMIKVTPQSGTMVMFEHDLYHAGAPLQWGTKYVLRTDILFHPPAAEEVCTEEEKKTGETAEVLEQKNPAVTDTPAPTSSSIVKNLCIEHEWPDTDMAVLNDMGLLDVTIEAFLAPGAQLVKAMLHEGGIESTEHIDNFLQAASDKIRNDRR